MADRLSWWVIPGALVVLVRIVTLDAPPCEDPKLTQLAPATPAVDVARGPVVVRDASGKRSTPRLLPVGNVLVLNLPKQCVGERVELTVWRRTANGREATPWMQAKPRVRADAVMPIAGQPAGAYDVEVEYGPVGARLHLQRDQVTVPGTVDLLPPNAAPVSGNR